MIHINHQAVLQDCTVRQHGDTGILIAEKQIYLPAWEAAASVQDRFLVQADGIDNNFFMKGGWHL